MQVRDMLTEDEAKTKVCAFIRYCVNEGEVLQDKATPLYYHNNCIASGCMSWRWSHQDSNGEPTGFCGGATLPKYI